jgi:hypothetical protein
MLQEYVSSVLDVSEVCFIRVFRTHVAIVFYMDVAYVSHICCMCFIQILRMVAMVFKCFRCVFQVFYKHVSSVSTAFMLQPLY